jgi:hypothetical protein
VDSTARNIAKNGLQDADPQIFIEAQTQVYNLMKYDCYKRFLESDDFHEAIRTEINGKDLPEIKESKQSNMFSWKSLQTRLSMSVSTRKTKKVPTATRFYDNVEDKVDKTTVTENSTVNMNTITPLKSEPPRKLQNTETRHRLKYLSQSEVNVARKSFYDSTPNMSPSSNFRNEMLLQRLLLNGRSLDFSDDKNSDAFFSDLMSSSQCAPPLTRNHKNLFPYLSQPAVSRKSGIFADDENEGGQANSVSHLRIDGKRPDKPARPSLVRFNISPVKNRVALRTSTDNTNKLPQIPERKFASRIPVKHKPMAPPPVPPKFKHPFPPPPPRQSRPRAVRMAANRPSSAEATTHKNKSVYV